MPILHLKTAFQFHSGVPAQDLSLPGSRRDVRGEYGKPLSVRFLSQNQPGPRMGMGHYERLLIESLLGSEAAHAQWRYDIRFAGRVPRSDLENCRQAGLAGAACEGYSPSRLARLPWGAARGILGLSQRLRSGGLPLPDLYHSLSLAYPAPAGRPAVYTIHDLPPARFDDEGRLPRWAKDAAQSAAAILTPSRFAKSELVALLGLPEERVHVVPNGYERGVFHPDVPAAAPAALAALGISGPFLLYCGGFTRRKNVRALLHAWKRIAPRFPDLFLALAGPAAPLAALLSETPAPRVTLAGYLDRDALPRVLKAATALVYPSIYEGFGLPPLEALALGVPVVAVRAGAVPEVTGECAVLAADGTADSLTAALLTLLENPGLAASLSRRGPEQATRFSWEDHAQCVMEVYRKSV